VIDAWCGRAYGRRPLDDHGAEHREGDGQLQVERRAAAGPGVDPHVAADRMDHVPHHVEPHAAAGDLGHADEVVSREGKELQQLGRR